MKRIISLIVAVAFAINASFAQTLDWTISNHTHISQVDTTVVTAPPVGTGSSTSSDSLFKMTIWIHGLAGGISSWNHVKAVTEFQSPSQTIPGYPARNTDGINLDYSTFEGGTLLAAADAMNDEIGIWEQSKNYDTLNIARKLAIAHSQGGMLARSMRMLNYSLPQSNPARFGSLITIGTPHEGAPLINSSAPSNNLVGDWITEGCSALGAAAFLQILSQWPWYVRILIDEPSLAQNVSGQFCEQLSATVLPLAISKVRKNISADYAVGSLALDDMRNHSSIDTLPTLVVYGVEQEPVLWRTAHSMTGALNDSTMSGSTLMNDPFGLNDDDDMATDVLNLSWTYSMLSAMYQLGPFSGHATIYSDASNWLTFANANWKRFIGARYDSVYVGEYICECLGQFIDTVASPTLCNQYLPNCPGMDVLQVLDLTTIDLPNDGVVPALSQKAYPGNIIGQPVKMENTNHMQMRNSTETKYLLNGAFDGDLGPMFKISRQ